MMRRRSIGVAACAMLLLSAAGPSATSAQRRHIAGCCMVYGEPCWSASDFQNAFGIALDSQTCRMSMDDNGTVRKTPGIAFSEDLFTCDAACGYSKIKPAAASVRSSAASSIASLPAIPVFIPPRFPELRAPVAASRSAASSAAASEESSASVALMQTAPVRASRTPQQMRYILDAVKQRAKKSASATSSSTISSAEASFTASSASVAAAARKPVSRCSECETCGDDGTCTPDECSTLGQCMFVDRWLRDVCVPNPLPDRCSTAACGICESLPQHLCAGVCVWDTGSRWWPFDDACVAGNSC